MKMPWSFLTRRRAANPSPDEIADVEEAFGTDREAAEPFDQQPVAVTSSVVPAEPEANLEEVSGQSVPPAADHAENLVAQPAEGYEHPAALEPNSRRSRQARREQRGVIAASPRDRSVPLPKADKHKTQSAVSEPTPRDGFVADASILEEEINNLRRELGEKLRLQNAQLREMLQRFDPS